MREAVIKTALGEREPELVLAGARIVDVFTATFFEGDVALCGGVIAGVGRYPGGERRVELGGRLLAPGLINAHCHVESAMAAPAVYCREELRWGVTTLVTDPHEIANVAGEEGVRFMLRSVRDLPINYCVQLPSCVPATPFEHSGAHLTAPRLAALAGLPGVTGLGEMMNYPGLLACDGQVLEKLAAFEGRTVDGHAPGLTGRALQAYVAAGVATDHESTTYAEAAEKLRAGMAVLVRQGSASRNLDDILTGVIRDGLDCWNLAFCTDDKHLADIRREGTIRHNLLRAIRLGMNPALAFRLATLNAARIYGLPRLGAVAPGYRADLVVFDSLDGLLVEAVYKDGREVALNAPEPSRAPLPPNSVRMAPLEPGALEPRRTGEESQPVIELVPGQIVTRRRDMSGGELAAALARGELCRLAVVERHHATGHVGTGYLAGFGLRGGAVATTVAHDSHNLILAGDSDRDMRLAAAELQRVGGGYAIVAKGRVLDVLPLPLYGLMSDRPASELIAALERITALARSMGVPPDVDPFITLSFAALPVIPALRLTDMGLFDVEHFQFIN